MLHNAKGNLLYLVMSFKGLEVSGLLDTGTKKILLSRELIRQVPDHQVVQHAAADTLQI